METVGRRKPTAGIFFEGEMTTFRLWAPFAQSVALTGDFNDWQETPLQRDTNDHWQVSLPHIPPGATYKYVLVDQAGNKLYRNDPRALQLTDSTGGVSVVPDPHFDWQDDHYTPPPKNQTVLYEMHIGTFARADRATPGTFAEAIKKLDYLQQLGITTIELMPVASFSGDPGRAGICWGYSPTNIYAVESTYGGREGLMQFVREAHKRQLGVILDVVYNHFGNDHLWRFDGWSEHEGGGIYFYQDDRAATPWGLRPDYGRPEVRDYILDNVQLWLADYHLDGLRIDSTIHTRNRHGQNNDPSGDIAEAWQLLNEINTLAHQIKPQALMIAEDEGVNEWLTKPVAAGGAGFDAQWDLSLPHTLRHALYGSDRPLDDIAYSLTTSFNGDPFEKVIFADSHDTATWIARITDPATNVALDLQGDEQIAILASALSLTAPGIPMLLQGQEFLEGGSFRNWQALDWSKAEQHRTVVATVRHWIGLRRNFDGQTGGLCGSEIAIWHRNDQNRVLGFSRGDGTNTVLVLVNFTGDAIGDYQITLPDGQERRLDLPPYGVLLIA